MKAYQFWILIVCSLIISVLMIKEIFLSRQLNQQQRQLAECQQLISEGANFDNAWKQLAGRIYQSSAQDLEMSGLLKKEGVQVHMQAPPPAAGAPAGPAPAPTAAPSPATP